MNRKLLFIFIFGIAIGIIILQTIFFMQVKKIERYDVLFEIKINTTYINVRTKPTPAANKIHEVLLDEYYSVIDYFDEDSRYVWYKIVYHDRRVGWVASHREIPWVIEIK